MPEAETRWMTNHLKEFKSTAQPRHESGLKRESASERLPADSHSPDDAVAADEVLNSGAEVEVEPSDSTAPPVSTEPPASAESASHAAKDSVQSPFPCHSCGRKVSSPDGYLLTTAEVVGSHRFWQRFYRQRYDELGTRLIYTYRDFSRDESIRELYVDPIAAREKPWLVCGECVRMFSISRNRAQGHAKLWWESDQTFLPPGNGAAAATAINLRGPWYGRIGPDLRGWTWGLVIIACVATVVMALISIPIRNHFTQVPRLPLVPTTPEGSTPTGDAPAPAADDSDLPTSEPTPAGLAPGELTPSDERLVPDGSDPTAAETFLPDVAPLYDPSRAAPAVVPMRADEGVPEIASEPPSAPVVAATPEEASGQAFEQPDQPPAAPPEEDVPAKSDENAGTRPALRNWTDLQGRTIKARLIRVSNGRVTLERVDGKTAEIDVESLSEADQEYVSSQDGKIDPAADVDDD